MKTYLILPNYIQDAADRIKCVIDWGIDSFKMSPDAQASNSLSDLESAVER